MSYASWVVSILAVAGLAVLLSFWWWRKKWLTALGASSRIAQTSRGSVEYALEGQGPVLLCFHGTAGGYDQGLGPGRFLNDLDRAVEFTLLSPSRPGYLRTPLATGRTPEEQADAFAALLDHLAIEKVAVLGVSGGGPFALQFALRHPQRLWALVLFSAITHQIPAGKRARLRARILLSRVGLLLLDLFLSTLVYLMLRFRTRTLARRLLRKMTAPTVATSDIHEQVETMLAHPDQVCFFHTVVRCMLPFSARAAGIVNDEEEINHLPEYPLERIRVPTLIVHGCEDAGVPASHVKCVTEKVPGAEVHAIERCGHFIWVGEHTQHMRATLVEFLRRHAPSRDSGSVSAGEPVTST